MPFLQRQEVSRGALTTHDCQVSELGDLICPTCGAHIITPPGFEVVAGWGRCPRCKKPFRVTRANAKTANLRTGAKTDPRRN